MIIALVGYILLKGKLRIMKKVDISILFVKVVFTGYIQAFVIMLRFSKTLDHRATKEK